MYNTGHDVTMKFQVKLWIQTWKLKSKHYFRGSKFMVYQPAFLILLIIHLLSFNFDDLMQGCFNSFMISDSTLD